MNKKLSKLLWPRLWAYFAVMVLFIAAAALTQNYILAGAEAAAAVLVAVFYLVSRERRKKALQQFAKEMFELPAEVKSADMPFPMAMVRLGDGSILWANDRFATITGYQDRLFSI